MKVLFKEIREDEEITVYDTKELYGEKGNFRILQFSDEAVQGAIDLDQPGRILFEYPRAIIHLMMINNPSFEHVFMIGHGIGTIAGHFTGKRFQIAEVDETVAELSKRYFGYRADNVAIGDGRHILGHEEPHTYDYLILDAFTDKGTPSHLVTREFFRLTKDKLVAQGSVIMNLMGKGANDRHMNAIHSTLREEYDYTQAFALPAERTTDIQNIIMMGSNKPIRYQLRHMAGFTDISLGQGYILWDNKIRE